MGISVCVCVCGAIFVLNLHLVYDIKEIYEA